MYERQKNSHVTFYLTATLIGCRLYDYTLRTHNKTIITKICLTFADPNRETLR